MSTSVPRSGVSTDRDCEIECLTWPFMPMQHSLVQVIGGSKGIQTIVNFLGVKNYGLARRDVVFSQVQITLAVEQRDRFL